MAKLGRLIVAMPATLLEAAGVLALVFLVARSVYYPFWAAQAAPAELARSWGGPSPVGATAAHWAIAAVGGALAWLGFRLGRRWRRRLLHPPVRAGHPRADTATRSRTGVR